MGARILVADDSVTIQKVVELTFSKEDFVLIPVRSGEEAIRKAKEVQPDLILLDLVMPDKNGYEVCTALRAEPMLRAVPIIMLTGTFESFDREQGLRAGANDFLTKPFESQALISRVKQLLLARTLDLGGPATPAPGAPPPPPVLTVPAKAGEPPTLELLGLEFEPIPDVPKTAGADASPFPQSLSLEELLAPDAVPPPHPTPPELPSGVTAESAPEAAPEPGPVQAQRRADELVFDLTADMHGPSLPLVEVGAGEPPALSGEEVRDRATVTPGQASAAPPPEPAPEAAPLEGLVAADELVFDLTADMHGPSLPLVEVGAGEPPELAIEDLLRPPGGSPLDSGTEDVPGLPLESFVESKPEAAVPFPEVPPALESAIEIPPEPSGTAAPSAGPMDIGDLVMTAPAPAAPPAALMAEILAAPAPSEGVEVLPVAPPKADVTPVAPPPTVGPAMEAAPPAAGLAPEMGALRQAVTERVAHELAKELSNQLIERIDRIVWEVVPDLAEILINREIERIRTMAEGKQPS